jgi:hypothetical protein
MVAEELVAADATLQEVADLGEEGLLGNRVPAIVPSVFNKHRKEGYHEEGGIDVGNEIGFGVRVVGKDGLFSVVSQRFYPLLAPLET